MTTPDLEALAREQLEAWAQNHEDSAASALRLGGSDPDAKLLATALAHRQAAALIRAKSPGREEIAREFEKLLSPYGRAASLTEYDSGRRSAFGWARDAILALFHTPAEGERG